MTDRKFPIMFRGSRRESVPWPCQSHADARARRNHCGQDLEELARRGGLGPHEMLAVLWDVPFRVDAITGLSEDQAMDFVRARLGESQHDTEYTDYPTCPHCGHVDQDWWDCDRGNDLDWEGECPSCERPYSVEMHVRTHFSTRKSS